MVKLPRFGRLRLPQRLTQRWRAGLSAQRRWWRARRRARAAAAGGAVRFPPEGHDAIAVETLAGPAAAARAGPRIAILHATAGSGHKRAAESLAAALSQMQPSAIVREVDTLVFASGLYRGTYAATYNAMAARAPRLWGVLYHSWAAAPVNKSTAPVRLALDRMNLRRLVRVVERESPEAVICTHFLPVEALSPRRGGGRLRVPLYCVITDFAAHPFWAFPHVDRYFVASAEGGGGGAGGRQRRRPARGSGGPARIGRRAAAGAGDVRDEPAAACEDRVAARGARRRHPRAGVHARRGRAARSMRPGGGQGRRAHVRRGARQERPARDLQA